MKVLNLFFIGIILYLCYKIFMTNEQFQDAINPTPSTKISQIELSDHIVILSKNGFINNDKKKIEELNKIKELDFGKNNLYVDNRYDNKLSIKENLCLGDYCINKDKMKLISGKINGPQFYKTSDDGIEDNPVYYNHDCNLSSSNNKYCNIETVNDLPNKLCFNYESDVVPNNSNIEDNKEYYNKCVNQDSATTTEEKYNVKKDRKKCLGPKEFDILLGKRGIKLKHTNSNNKLLSNNILKAQKDYIQTDIIGNISNTLDVDKDGKNVIPLPDPLIGNYDSTCSKINWRLPPVGDQEIGECCGEDDAANLSLYDKLSSDNCGNPCEKGLETNKDEKKKEFKIKQCVRRFMSTDLGQQYVNDNYLEHATHSKNKPGVQNDKCSRNDDRWELPPHNMCYKFEIYNLNTWTGIYIKQPTIKLNDKPVYFKDDTAKYIFMTKDNKWGGKELDKSLKIDDTNPEILSLSSIINYSKWKIKTNGKLEIDCDAFSLCNFCCPDGQSKDECINNFNKSDEGTEYNIKYYEKTDSGNPGHHTITCPSPANWKLPPTKKNPEGLCCANGVRREQCWNTFKNDNPDYVGKSNSKNISPGKYKRSCPAPANWELPGKCCDEGKTRRECWKQYLNDNPNYSEGVGETVAEISQDDFKKIEDEYPNHKYLMPYYMDFRETGMDIESTKDQLLFKNNNECAHSKSLFELNPNFNPRKYPYYKDPKSEINCENVDCNDKFKRRMCLHTCSQNIIDSDDEEEHQLWLDKSIGKDDGSCSNLEKYACVTNNKCSFNDDTDTCENQTIIDTKGWMKGDNWIRVCKEKLVNSSEIECGGIVDETECNNNSCSYNNMTKTCEEKVFDKENKKIYCLKHKSKPIEKSYEESKTGGVQIMGKKDKRRQGKRSYKCNTKPNWVMENDGETPSSNIHSDNDDIYYYPAMLLNGNNSKLVESQLLKTIVDEYNKGLSIYGQNLEEDLGVVAYRQKGKGKRALDGYCCNKAYNNKVNECISDYNIAKESADP